MAPSSQLFGPTIRRTGDASTIALTFDDGPNPAVTPALLDLLDRHDVKATFFLIGAWVSAGAGARERNCRAAGTPSAITPRRIQRSRFCSAQRITDELDRCDEAIESATGTKPRWMRPPFGFRSPLLDGDRAKARRRGRSDVVRVGARLETAAGRAA